MLVIYSCHMLKDSNKHRYKSVLVRLPKEIMPELDAQVKLSDLDRSKFIRHAIKEKINRSRAIS